MRNYNIEHAEPVNSKARTPLPITIPPFEFIGYLETSTSSLWPCSTNFRLTGAQVTATATGIVPAELVIIKNNSYETIDAATCSLPALSVNGIFTLSEALSGDHYFTPYDKISVASLTSSNHQGIVVQMYGVRMS